MTKIPNKLKKYIFLPHFCTFSPFLKEKYYFQKIGLCHTQFLGPLTPCWNPKITNEPIPRKLLDGIQFSWSYLYLFVIISAELRGLPKWELKEETLNTNLFVNINNNTAPFVFITWHQKEPLGCVVYSHCPTKDSYNKCIHSSCLPWDYVIKPFGILQRVIKSQRVLTSF